MLYRSAKLDERELTVLAEIEDLRVRLRFVLNEPHRWTGSLRRLSFARMPLRAPPVSSLRSFRESRCTR